MLARVGTRMRAPGAWGSSLPRWLSARGRAWPPGFDRGDDLLGRVFLDVVRGPAEDVGPVVGEGALPSPTVGFPEARVLVAPDDEGPACRPAAPVPARPRPAAGA